MTHRCPQITTFHAQCEQTGGKFCLRPRWEKKKSVSCHRAPGHVTVVTTVILVLIRKRRSWNWGVNQSETNKSRRTESREKIHVNCGLKPKVDCIKRTSEGVQKNQQLGLTDTTRAHAYNTRLCSTMLSPMIAVWSNVAKFHNVLRTPPRSSSCQGEANLFQPLYFLHLLHRGGKKKCFVWTGRHAWLQGFNEGMNFWLNFWWSLQQACDASHICCLGRMLLPTTEAFLMDWLLLLFPRKHQLYGSCCSSLLG